MVPLICINVLIKAKRKNLSCHIRRRFFRQLTSESQSARNVFIIGDTCIKQREICSESVILIIEKHPSSIRRDKSLLASGQYNTVSINASCILHELLMFCWSFYLYKKFYIVICNSHCKNICSIHIVVIELTNGFKFLLIYCPHTRCQSGWKQLNIINMVSRQLVTRVRVRSARIQ